MAYTIIVHISNEPAFLAEIEELPKPTDVTLTFSNPRTKDGKALSQLDADANLFIYPWARINFVEVLPERGSRDELVEFFRED